MQNQDEKDAADLAKIQGCGYNRYLNLQRDPMGNFVDNVIGRYCKIKDAGIDDKQQELIENKSL